MYSRESRNTNNSFQPYCSVGYSWALGWAGLPALMCLMCAPHPPPTWVPMWTVKFPTLIPIPASSCSSGAKKEKEEERRTIDSRRRQRPNDKRKRNNSSSIRTRREEGICLHLQVEFKQQNYLLFARFVFWKYSTGQIVTDGSAALG